jgi:hypothetical protein
LSNNNFGGAGAKNNMDSPRKRSGSFKELSAVMANTVIKATMKPGGAAFAYFDDNEDTGSLHDSSRRASFRASFSRRRVIPVEGRCYSDMHAIENQQERQEKGEAGAVVVEVGQDNQDINLDHDHGLLDGDVADDQIQLRQDISACGGNSGGNGNSNGKGKSGGGSGDSVTEFQLAQRARLMELEAGMFVRSTEVNDLTDLSNQGSCYTSVMTGNRNHAFGPTTEPTAAGTNATPGLFTHRAAPAGGVVGSSIPVSPAYTARTA